MRRRNLPDGGHDKVTSKVKTKLQARRHDSVTPRRERDVSQQHYWVVHLGVTGDVVEM